MKILANYNIKGGVGKTASAVNLAWCAAQQGYRTVIWDLDPQGAASYYFRIKPRVKGGSSALISREKALDEVVKGTDFDNLDLIPADFSYRNLDLDLSDAKRPTRQLLKLLRPLADEYDLLFIDTAPSISLVSENIFQAAHGLLIPMIPTVLSVRTYSQLLKYFKQHPQPQPALMPFFSMVDQRKRLHRELMVELLDKHPEMLKSAIPSASAVELMGIKRAPVGCYAPESPSAQAFEALWDEVSQRIF